MSDQSAAPVEPTAPEGGESSGLPWDLNDAPEELRPYLTTELKKIEGNITKKFQENSEYRKQMEPYGALSEVEGLTDVPAEELTDLLQFREMLTDTEPGGAFEDWWSSVGEQLGYFQGEEGGEQDAAADEPPEWAQKMMQELDVLKGNQTQSQATQREQQALQHIESELGALREQHGDFDEDAVCQLAMAYDDEDAVSKGFADYQRLTGAAQSQLVDGKESVETGSPVSGGSADTAPEPVNGFAEAKRLAKARMASAR